MSATLFSAQSSIYAAARPRYPKELFEWIANQCSERKLAWDCATGNGQAANSLTEFFEHVIATDISAEQIKNQIINPKVEYRVADSTNSGIESHSADLVTVSQALHWFDNDSFYEEVRRVLKPNGLFICWSYFGFESGTNADDFVNQYFAQEFLKDYWSAGAWKNMHHYRDIYFPFEKIQALEFYNEVKWNAADVLNYIRSWSAVQAYKNKNGNDPVTTIEKEFRDRWGSGEEKRPVRWKLQVLATKA